MPETSALMRGKRGLIMGVANNRSIAWGIARACRDHGADLAFTYQGDALKKRVEPLAEEVDGLVVGHCDVTDPASMDAVFGAVKSAWGSLDFLLHAIAFSDKDQLDGRYVDTTEDNFIKTMVVSCYSFTALAQRAEKLMTNGGSLLTMTYYGAEKWMPHYNVMGLAKAALESSVRYLAADLGAKVGKCDNEIPQVFLDGVAALEQFRILWIENACIGAVTGDEGLDVVAVERIDLPVQGTVARHRSSPFLDHASRAPGIWKWRPPTS